MGWWASPRSPWILWPPLFTYSPSFSSFPVESSHPRSLLALICYTSFLSSHPLFSHFSFSHTLSLPLFSVVPPLICHLILLGEPEVVVGLQKLGVFCQLRDRDGGVTHHTCRGSKGKAEDQNRLKSPLLTRTPVLMSRVSMSVWVNAFVSVVLCVGNNIGVGGYMYICVCVCVKRWWVGAGGRI